MNWKHDDIMSEINPLINRNAGTHILLGREVWFCQNPYPSYQII